MRRYRVSFVGGTPGHPPSIRGLNTFWRRRSVDRWLAQCRESLLKHETFNACVLDRWTGHVEWLSS